MEISMQIDTREKLAKVRPIVDSLMKTYPEFNEIEITYKKLDLADYLLRNGDVSFLVERKSMNDMVGTYTKLRERLMEMRLANDHIGLILEGDYVVHDGQVCVRENNQWIPRMSYTAFNNYLIHQQTSGLYLMYTGSRTDSLRRLMMTVQYLPKMVFPSPSIKVGNIQEWLLLLNGLGTGTLKKLQSKYDNPLAALADCSKWLPKKAKEDFNKW